MPVVCTRVDFLRVYLVDLLSNSFLAKGPEIVINVVNDIDHLRPDPGNPWCHWLCRSTDLQNTMFNFVSFYFSLSLLDSEPLFSIIYSYVPF